MKINRVQGQYLKINAYKAKDEKKNMDIKNMDAKKEKAVNIEISNSAKELVEKIGQSYDTNFSERVEKIRQSILDGTYKVSTEDIADKILQTINNQKGSDK